MTEKSAQITFPPTCTYVDSSKKKVAKICAFTSICVTVIIATAVCLGLYFTRQYGSQQEFTLQMKNNNEEIPLQISLNTENQLEYVTVPKTAGFNEVIILRDYNQGLMAFKDVTSGGDCLISGFDGKPQDIKEVHKTLTDNKNLGIKVEKEITFSILLEPIHPEVLRFATGEAIANWCNSSSYWMISKEVSMKKRSLSTLPATGVPANMVQVNPVPLSQELLNSNGGQILNINSFLAQLGNKGPVAPPVVPGVNLPQVPVSIPPNQITPVILFGGNRPATLPSPQPLPFPVPSPVPLPSLLPSPLPSPFPVPSPSILPSLPISPPILPPSIPTPGAISPPRPTVSSCDTKCAVANGVAAFSLAQAFYFCDLNCIPKNFVNGR